MHTSIRLTAPFIIASALFLSGCGAGGAVEDAVDEIVDAQTGGDGGGGAGEPVNVPDSFPAELPRPGGVLETAIEQDGGWQLVYTLPLETETDRVVNALAEAYTQDSASESGGVRSWQFSAPDWQITITEATADDGTVTFTYVVVER